MIVNQAVLAIVIMTIFFGSVGVGKITGTWQTMGRRTPLAFSSGSIAGINDPADIRGSWTFGEISNLYDIPLKDLGKAFALKDEKQMGNFLCKDLESLYVEYSKQGKDVGTHTVRVFVAWYKGLPIDERNAYFPDTVKEVLNTKGSLTNAQKALLSSRLVPAVIVTNIPEPVRRGGGHGPGSGQGTGQGQGQAPGQSGPK